MTRPGRTLLRCMACCSVLLISVAMVSAQQTSGEPPDQPGHGTTVLSEEVPTAPEAGEGSGDREQSGQDEAEVGQNQQGDDNQGDQPSQGDQAGDEEQAGGKSSESINPCAPYDLANNAWIDRLHQRLFKSVCSSAFWFDRFFGDERLYDEARHTYGRIGLRLYWDEYDHLATESRFRVHVALPNLNDRFDAFMARVDEEEYLSSPEPENRSLRTARDEDKDWLVGFGYYPLRDKQKHFRISAGASLSFPINPYVRARYRYYHPISDKVMFRFRQTVFWRREERFGTTTNFDFEQWFGDKYLLRWANSLTFSETTRGVRWWTSYTLFQDLARDRALAYKMWWKGESDAAVAVDDYGLQVVYRQSVLREWLFGEIGAEVSWPKEHSWEQRKESWGVIIGVEMYFGKL